MIRIAMALLLLALAGCVDPMPLGDENDQLLNKEAQAKTPEPWVPRMLFE